MASRAVKCATLNSNAIGRSRRLLGKKCCCERLTTFVPSTVTLSIEYEICFECKPVVNGTTRLPWSQTGAVPCNLLSAPRLLWSVTWLTSLDGTALPSRATKEGRTRYHTPRVR